MEEAQDAITDGPVIASDLGAPALFVAYAEVGVVAVRPTSLLRFWPCLGGAPGSDECPLSWKASVTIDNEIHPNVVVNPCTHHAVPVWRDGGTVMAGFRNFAGTTAADDYQIDSGVALAPNSECSGESCADFHGDVCRCQGPSASDCGEDDGCWDLAGRVHATTVVTQNGECLLLAAYDRSAQAADGETYFKARLRIVDITNEEAPAEVATVNSAPTATTNNDFSATVVADRFEGGIGLFFYRQRLGDACDTIYAGRVGASVAGPFNLVTVSDAAFPSMRFDFTDGMGHYVEATRLTEPGWLLASWSEPIPTSAACVSCEGAEYALASFAARVRP